MVRTAATAVRTGGGKSSKGAVVMGSSRGGGGSSTKSAPRRTIGGNKHVNRPIPLWQKPITKFFQGGDEHTVVHPTEYVEEEEEQKVIQPPEWQKPVSEFLSKQINEDLGESSKASSVSQNDSNSAETQLKKRELGESSKVPHHTVNDTISAKPQLEEGEYDSAGKDLGESSKTSLSDKENEPKSTETKGSSANGKRQVGLDTIDIDKGEQEANPAKRKKPSFDYKLLEEYENC